MHCYILLLFLCFYAGGRAGNNGLSRSEGSTLLGKPAALSSWWPAECGIIFFPRATSRYRPFNCLWGGRSTASATAPPPRTCSCSRTYACCAFSRGGSGVFSPECHTRYLLVDCDESSETLSRETSQPDMCWKCSREHCRETDELESRSGPSGDSNGGRRLDTTTRLVILSRHFAIRLRATSVRQLNPLYALRLAIGWTGLAESRAAKPKRAMRNPSVPPDLSLLVSPCLVLFPVPAALPTVPAGKQSNG